MARQRVRAARSLAAALALAALLPTAARAEDLGTLPVLVPHAPEGLPPGAVRALLADARGFLWIASDGGLARYDGARFRRFDRTSEPALDAGAASVLAEDAAGALWIGTRAGARVWDGTAFSAPLAGGGAEPAVTALAAAPDGTVWIGTPAGLVRFAAGRVHRYGTLDGAPAAPIADLALDATGALWIASAAGVARAEGERFRTLSSRPAHALAAAGDGTVFAAVASDGGEAVIELPAGREVLRRAAGGASSALARRLLVDRAGDLWLAGDELARRRAASPLVDVDRA